MYRLDIHSGGDGHGFEGWAKRPQKRTFSARIESRPAKRCTKILPTTILIISLSGNVDDSNEHEGDATLICSDDPPMTGNKCWAKISLTLLTWPCIAAQGVFSVLIARIYRIAK